MIETHETTDDRQADLVLRTLRRTRQIREFTVIPPRPRSADTPALERDGDHWPSSFTSADR